jgi:hypothetical protein
MLFLLLGLKSYFKIFYLISQNTGYYNGTLLHIKACASGPWRLKSGWLNFVYTSCLIKDAVRTGTHIVWTITVVFPYLCQRWKSFYLSNTGHPGGIASSSGRLNWCTWTLDYSGSLKSGRTICHYVRTNATLNSSKLLDTDGGLDWKFSSSGWMLLTDERSDGLQGRPDGCLGSDFSELEFAQNLPGTSEIAFFILVKLNLS